MGEGRPPPCGTSYCLQHSGLVESITGLEKAVLVAKIELERRLEGMNEFRAQLDRQAGTLGLKTEMATALEKLEAVTLLRLTQVERDVKEIMRRMDVGHGSKAWSSYIVTIVMAAVVFIAFGSLTR